MLVALFPSKISQQDDSVFKKKQSRTLFSLILLCERVSATATVAPRAYTTVTSEIELAEAKPDQVREMKNAFLVCRYVMGSMIVRMVK